MSNVNVTKDIPNKKMTIETEVSADRQKVWDAWTDGVSLEKWWGPQGWPATTKSFDFKDGGHWHYKMTGPDGTESWAWLGYNSVNPIDSFTATDTFSDADGNRAPGMPSMHWDVSFVDEGDKTRIVTNLTLDSEADLQKLLEMGFESGYTQTLENLGNYLTGKPVYAE